MADVHSPAAFHFMLRIGSDSSLSEGVFAEAIGMGREIEVEGVGEGGENRFHHQLPKGFKPANLTLKHGLVPAHSELVKWCKDVLGGGLTSAIKPQHIELDLAGTDGKPLASWSFDNAYPLRWSVVDDPAERFSLLVECIELAYVTSKRKL